MSTPVRSDYEFVTRAELTAFRQLVVDALNRVITFVEHHHEDGMSEAYKASAQEFIGYLETDDLRGASA